MTYQKYLQASGHFIFKYRGILPVPFLLYPLFAFFFLAPTQSSKLMWPFLILASGCIAVGALVRTLAVGTAMRGTSGRNRESQYAASLNTTGMYSLVRHPLYVGNFLVAFGIMLLFGEVAYALVGGLLIFIAYERIICVEELFLQEKFKDKFTNWADKIPAYIPNFLNYTSSALNFSWRKTFHAEYRGGGATSLLIVYMDIMRKSVHSGFEYENWHIYTTISALLLLVVHKGVRLLLKS